MYRGVIERGDIHSQPFSEGLAPGATSRRGDEGRAGRWWLAGDRPQDLRLAVRRGHVLQRHLPGAGRGRDPAARRARRRRRRGDRRRLGSAGHARHRVAHAADEGRVRPALATSGCRPGCTTRRRNRYPWLFLSLCPSYLGLTGGILDTTRLYLRGELPGQVAGSRRDHPDQAGRLGADAAEARAVAGDAVPRGRRGGHRPHRGRAGARAGRRRSP